MAAERVAQTEENKMNNASVHHDAMVESIRNMDAIAQHLLLPSYSTLIAAIAMQLHVGGNVSAIESALSGNADYGPNVSGAFGGGDVIVAAREAARA